MVLYAVGLLMKLVVLRCSETLTEIDRAKGQWDCYRSWCCLGALGLLWKLMVLYAVGLSHIGGAEVQWHCDRN
jgi:hypothetical protein